MTSLTGCLDKYIICQLPGFVNFPLISFSSAVASPIQFTGILSQSSLYHFRAVYCLCNKRLFSFISLYPINYTLEPFPSVFAPVLCFHTNNFPPITLYTADTSWIPTGVCSPGKYPCSPVLLPYRFSKYAQSDAPPRTNHPAEIRPQFPYL